MNEEPRDGSLLIGLHKLAEQNGDGLVPELYALLSGRREAAMDAVNVVAFPCSAAARSPAGAAVQRTASRKTGGVVLQLRRP
ncbi:hypothetical protein EPK99_09775 [Neorhizobium lilium]|uniref:Uncharacterized protein n=1 Tax=Neorhizobium lilium TaxID=2503024 RepID=A0A444LIX3_9HYPH|nr:hypothetical protein [Neorhizobium lilium]RWX78857.1 hypothetical protein EPK99_09775 [Neorhizobium lilium]